LGNSATPPPGFSFAGAISIGNTWVTVESMPTKRDRHAAAAVNGKVYAIGGFNDLGFTIATVVEYDPVSNAWTTVAPMPTARNQLTAAAVNGKVYAIGGALVATVEEFIAPSDLFLHTKD
jgi:N-acetylneuraminic acid mutarotase